MKIRSPRTLLFILLLLFGAPVVSEEIVIIVSPDNTESLEIEDVARIYLGKRSRFPGGGNVIPLDINPGDPAYGAFALRVLKKTPTQLRAYWAKRIFTGKGKPPRVVTNAQEMLQLVQGNSQFLGYAGREHLNDSVRQILVIAP